MATKTARKRTNTKTAASKATKVAPPKPIEEGGQIAEDRKAVEATAKAKADAKAASDEKAAAAADKASGKGKAKKPAKDVEALNTRGVYSTTRKSLDPPTYVSLNGRWMEVKCAEPMTKGDLRHSAKTPWALIDLRGKEPKVLDYVCDSDTALKVAVHIDGKAEAMPDKHPNLRPAGYKPPVKDAEKDAKKTA